MSPLVSGGHRVWVRLGIILLLMPGSVWPWGRTGHGVSAMMAESRLTPAALAEVRSLLSKVCFLGHPAKRDSYPDERPNIDLRLLKAGDAK
jgi:hypothetical protein